MKLFNSHISTATLADAIDERLTPNERSEMQQHLSNCANCRAEFAILEKSIGLMRRDRAQDAPAEAVNFAKNLFRARRQFVPREASVMQKINAVLKFDLSAFAPAFGERSASTGEQRQMLFSAGERDVDLRVRKTGEKFVVSGQILGDIGSQENSARLAGGNFSAEIAINELGEFTFKDVITGIYELNLKIGELEVTVSDLEV